MQVCLKSYHQKDMKWHLDSCCSRHMIGNRSQLRSLRSKDGGIVKFANGIKLKIIGISNIGYSSVSTAYWVYNKRTQAVEETIHISFKAKKKDLDQNIHDLEEDMENLSLNNDFQNQQSLQISTRKNNEDMALILNLHTLSMFLMIFQEIQNDHP